MSPTPDDIQRPHLSVVIPMYREARRIRRTIAEAATFARASDRTIELVLVNDGSDDDTAIIAQAALLTHSPSPFVRAVVISHTTNLGKGAAIRTGLAESKGQWTLCMDADGSCAIGEVEKLLRAATSANAALAAGSRRMPDSVVHAVVQRQLMSSIFRAALSIMGMGLLRDTQCGFKLYRRDAADYIAHHARENGYTFDLEHILLVKDMGVVEVGVVWTHIPGGQVRPIRDGLAMLRSAAALRWRMRGRTPVAAGPPPIIPESHGGTHDDPLPPAREHNVPIQRPAAAHRR